QMRRDRGGYGRLDPRRIAPTARATGLRLRKIRLGYHRRRGGYLRCQPHAWSPGRPASPRQHHRDAFHGNERCPGDFGCQRDLPERRYVSECVKPKSAPAPPLSRLTNEPANILPGRQPRGSTQWEYEMPLDSIIVCPVSPSQRSVDIICPGPADEDKLFSKRTYFRK